MRRGALRLMVPAGMALAIAAVVMLRPGRRENEQSALPESVRCVRPEAAPATAASAGAKATAAAPAAEAPRERAEIGATGAVAEAPATAPATRSLSGGQERVLAHYEEVSRRDAGGVAPGGSAGIFRQRILRAPDDAGGHVLVEETVLPGRNVGDERVVQRTAMAADRVLVKLRPGVSAEDLHRLNGLYGARVVEKPLAEDLYLVELQGLDPDAVRRTVAIYEQAAASVSYAEPDYLLWTSAMPNDPMFSGLWGMHNVGQMSDGTATIVAGGTTLSGNVLTFSGLAPSPGVTGTMYDCGVGKVEEFPAGVSGNVAVIQRGGLDAQGGRITFRTKVENAVAAGATAVIIYNDEPGDFTGTLAYAGDWPPAVAVSDTKGAQLLAIGNVPATATIEPAPSVDRDIDAPEAWDIIEGSESVVAGVIDTGVDYNHPDLAANMWVNPGEIAGDGLDNDGNGYIDDIHGWNFAYHNSDPMDDHYHGTHVAGTIGAVGNNSVGVVGVCWNVRIMALKFLGGSGGGTVSAAIPAIEYARTMGAKLTSNSWGGTEYSQALKDAIDAAGAAGVLFVAAAGNDGENNDYSPHYPASYNSSNIIAVAATDHMDDLASFSCYGVNSVDLAAPGVNIYSTFPTYETAAMTSGGHLPDYGAISGTSMATPHVAGVCALLYSLAPDAAAADVKARVLGQTDYVAGLAGKCVSGGRLNAFRAVAIPGPPELRVAGVAVSDAGGNGDGIVNPGETVQLTITLRNLGVSTSVGVNATVASSDPMVTVVDANAAFGNMAGWGSRTEALDPFAIAISPSCHTPREVTLTLNITDSGSDAWTDTCKVTVFTSSLISGTVTSLADGTPLAGATIEYAGPRSGAVQTDAGGNYNVVMSDGIATLTASHPGYCSSTPVTVTVPPDAPDVDFSMGFSRAEVSPASFDVSAVLGDLPTRTMTIHNSGNSALTWRLSNVSAPLGSTIRKISPAVAGGAGLACNGETVWINYGDMYKSDGLTGKALGTLNTASVVSNPYGIGWDSVNGWLWLAEINGKVKAVDTKTGALMKTMDGGGGTTSVAVGDGCVWVLGWEERTVRKRNATTGALLKTWKVPVQLAGRISGIAYYKGAVWISTMNGGELADGMVYKLDAENGSVLASFMADVPEAPNGGYNVWDLAVDERNGLLWLLTDSHRAVLAGMGESAPWLKAGPIVGTVAPGASVDVELTLDAATAGPGVHEATLEIVSNDPAEPKLSIPVKLSVMTSAGNRPPVIDNVAWADQARIFSPYDSFTLSSATTAVHVVASDPDGDQLSYAWSGVSGYGGPQFTDPDAADSAVELSPAKIDSGLYAVNTNVLRVTVSDGKGGIAVSDVIVSVAWGSPVIHTDPDNPEGGLLIVGTGVSMSEDGSPTNFSLTLYAWDAGDSTLTWSIAAPALAGTATASGGGAAKAIGYTPHANYSGWDYFMVQVSNERNQTDRMNVTVWIDPVNDAPVAVDDVYSMSVNTELNVGAPGVLRNDSDVDGGVE